MTETTPAAAPATSGGEDDFFSTWDKPTSKPASTASTPAVTAPPVIGKPTAPRTVTSASLRSGSTPGLTAAARASKLGAARVGSATSLSSAASGATTPAGGAVAKKGKLGGLGAKKAAAPLDFAEAERRAAEEAERIRQLGYDREREEEEARKASEAAAAAQKAAASKPGATTTTRSATAPAGPPKPLGNDQDMARLGMGMKRLGFGAVPVAAAPAAKAAEDESNTYARDKFGNQKGISSDMYFERGTYDAAATSEAQQRLRSFQGATSISSNAYFGRDDEEGQAGSRGGEGDGMLGDGSLGNIEYAARDALQRVMSNPDVQNAAESLRAGAMKVRVFSTPH